MKSHLAFGKFQIRSLRGIRRLWDILSLAHLICCIGTGQELPFHEGRKIWSLKIHKAFVTNIYNAGREGVSLEDVIAKAC